MKFFTSKSVAQKLLIAIILVILINFTLTPTFSHANLAEDITNIFLELFLKIGDGIMWLLHKIVFGFDESMYKIIREDAKVPWWKTALLVICGVLAIAAWIVGCIVTGGVLAVVSGVVLVGALAGGAVVGFSIAQDVYAIEMGRVPPTLYLPAYILSPQEIFSNRVPMLDVNFFNPMGDDVIEEIQIPKDKSLTPPFPAGTPTDTKYLYKTGQFVNGEEVSYIVDTKSTAAEIRPTIAKWYNTLRTFALIALMTILVYVGIRIILSSTANEKAKYKGMIGGWLTAMCLLFILHYIMAFSIEIVVRISDAIARGDSGQVLYTITDDKTREYVWGEKSGMSDEEKEAVAPLRDLYVDGKDGPLYWVTNLLGSARMESQWLATYNVDEAVTSSSSSNIDTDQTIWQKAAYTLIYLVVIIFTIMFLLHYLKRLLILAFLTLIAPLITVTYPIDKIGDGQAQAFNYWIKEYMFNLLLQPFHLIIYTVFIVAAFDFASKNFLYVVAVLWFMTHAEKIMRKMFNFESDTNKPMSPLAAGALGALGSKALHKLASGGNKKDPAGPGKPGGNEQQQQRSLPRTSSTDGWDSIGDENNRGGNPDTDGAPPLDTGDEAPPLDTGDEAPPFPDEPPPDFEERDEAEDERINDYLNSDEHLQDLEDRDNNRDDEIQDYQDYLDSDDYIADQEAAALAAEEEQNAFIEEMDRLEQEEQAAQEEQDRIRMEEEQQEQLDTEQEMAEEAAEEIREQLEGERQERLSDRMRRNAAGRAALGVGNVALGGLKGLGRKIGNPKTLRGIAGNAIKYTAMGTGAVIGAGLSVAESVASGESPGRAFGETAAAAGVGAVAGKGISRLGGSAANFGGNIASGARNLYREGANPDGRSQAVREEDIRRLENSDTYTEYVDRHHESMNQEEKQERRHEMAEFQTETGVSNLDIIRKALNEIGDPEQGKLTEEQARSAAMDASDYTKANFREKQAQIKAALKQEIQDVLEDKYKEEQGLDDAAAKQAAEERAEELAEEKIKAIRKLLK